MRWIIEARKFLGLKEIKGSQHAQAILDMWKAIKRGGIKDDETPWCAAFVGACLEQVGIQSTRFESAKSYLDWGAKLNAPVLGCVVVFTRTGGGHVGFVVGKSPAGNLLVLGGNQSDEVNIREFPLTRVTGYRWPQGEPLPAGELPIGSPAGLSAGEA
ncbi:TIGR02594 family protein [Aeromonas veronii]|uniref:TIGR02594 family protein n=1 Tax=Aeromonas veronii TaxID=654 RepID=A0A3A9IGX9_AERVE|nr:TIGR02594 family protein [Aeromonas veronii]RKJ83779.1 TIGR02594 family protein [Aeromonas veronii]RKJ84396.1 TIGR02594 family protein [Aeromonas veronii]RKJ92182.1 TIGR02594 family protein [Aeromonas veronii]